MYKASAIMLPQALKLHTGHAQVNKHKSQYEFAVQLMERLASPISA